MAPRRREPGGSGKRPIAQYTHDKETRVNNPPVGLVDSASDAPVANERTYAHDPHIDPQLQWSGKAERTSFEVPTVSLHVHERIDPRSILEAVRKKNGSNYEQLSLWSSAAENPPLRDAIEFYRHRHGWTNRMIAGDSLLVMNSLAEKEGMAGKVQMIYFDPPYGIRYGSNFQPFVNKRDVKDGKDEGLTAEPEMIKAFRDTWELGIHSYLSYLRDRLLLARELLAESGSVFVQISDENVHHVREIMDEVFGAGNFVSLITFKKTASQTAKNLPSVADYLLWYARDVRAVKFRTLHCELKFGDEGTEAYSLLRLSNGSLRPVSRAERIDAELLPAGAHPCQLVALHSERAGRPSGAGTAMHFPVEFEGRNYFPPGSRGWTTTRKGMDSLIKAGRIAAQGNSIRYVRYIADYPAVALSSVWDDTQSGSGMDKYYVVQTNTKVIQRCILMTTDPGDLVLDITCGSGTTATVAEQWGRRWITCDTSRVALALAKQRLMTSVYDYYKLAHADEGVGSGFLYKKVPHVTLKSIANNEPAAEETLYDQPLVDTKKVRVCGPFTVEAVPAPVVAEVDSGQWAVDSGESGATQQSDLSTIHYPLSTRAAEPGDYVGRQGETLRQEEWRQELLRTGIRGKRGQYLMFSRVEPLPGTRWLHAEAEIVDSEKWIVSSEKALDSGGSAKRVDSGEWGVDSEGSGATQQSKLSTAHHPLSTNSPPLRRAVISFGPAHAPLEQRQVEQALEEARTLVPKPQIVVFAAFQFDPEAAKDIDQTRWPGLTLLKAQMNADLLTDDLKKKRASNESFWMVGQPDVEVVSGEWLVDSGGRAILDPYETAKLSRLIGVAKIDGIGPADVSRLKAMAARGDLRVDQPDPAGGGLGSVEHRRGARKKHDGGVPPRARDGERIAGGTGDPTDLGGGPRLPEGRGSGPVAGPGDGSRQDASSFDAEAALEKLATAHFPLSTATRTQVRVVGFDYFNPKTGEIESGSGDRIAVWMLDTDYDGRSLFPRQVFFPMAGDKEGWARLAKNLRAEIDLELVEA